MEKQISSLSVKPLFDLEERTLLFADKVRQFLKKLPRSQWHSEDIKQLLRSSGSVAANYVEANEAVGSRDFLMRIRICLKESKESRLWLRLLSGIGSHHATERDQLVDEANQLVRIFSAALRTVRRRKESEKSIDLDP